MSQPVGRRKEQIEERLRGDLPNWRNRIQDVKNALNNIQQNYMANPSLAANHSKDLERLMQEISQAESDLAVIAQDLTAAKADAEYRAVLVQAWPSNSFLDRLAYLSAAILGAGGAAFLFGGWPVTIVFWLMGGAMMVYALVGLRRWELKKWEFFADQFTIRSQFRPWGNAMIPSSGYLVGASAILLGIVMAWWGSGQCILSVYDPLCPFWRFELPIFGGLSIAFAGAAWTVYVAIKHRSKDR